MATISQPRTSATTREFPQSSVEFDWVVVLLEALWVGGVFVDGWAHAHGKVDQSFFTPWHAILYAGFFVNALFFASVAWRNHARDYPWSRSVPRGYEFAALGVGIFLVGGVLDLLWHLLFGIERSLSATLSPTHLMLALGVFLAASGPWRAAWLRTPTHQRESLVQLLPMLVSLAYVLSILTFFTQYANPIVKSWADKQTLQEMQELGVASILLSTSLLIGVVLLSIRRWQLPLGSFTIMLTINPSTNERTHQPIHETMNLRTGTQIMTTFSKARCAHRKCLQFQAISAKASVGCAPGKSQKVIVRVITPLELERGSLPVWTPANAIPTLSRTVSVFTNREMQ